MEQIFITRMGKALTYKEVYNGAQESHEGGKETRNSWRLGPLKSMAKAHNNKVLIQKELSSS